MSKDNTPIGVEAVKALLEYDNNYCLRDVDVKKDTFDLEIKLGNLKFAIRGPIESMLQIGLQVAATGEPELSKLEKATGFLKGLPGNIAKKVTAGSGIGKQYIKAATKVFTSKDFQDELLARVQERVKSDKAKV